MSKRQLLCVLGAWMIVFLFLGFPAVWDKIFAVLSGLAVISIAYGMKMENSSDGEIR